MEGNFNNDNSAMRDQEVEELQKEKGTFDFDKEIRQYEVKGFDRWENEIGIKGTKENQKGCEKGN